MNNTIIFRVLRDGVEQARFEDSVTLPLPLAKCWGYIHRYTSFSVRYACQYEGYAIQELVNDVWENIQIE